MSIIAEFKNEQGQSLGIIVLTAKEFSTKSQGYFGQGKVTNVDGRVGQVQAQWVNVKSAPGLENHDPDFFAPSKVQKKAEQAGEDDANAGRDVLDRVHPGFAKLVGQTINPVKAAKKTTTRKTGKKK